VLVAGKFDARELVFVDEMGTHSSLAPLYGYSPRGEPAYLEVPRNRGKNATLIASLSTGGIGECLAVEGAITKVLFEAYVERVLTPSLRIGQVVVMDNLSAHKGEKVRKLIEAKGCKLIFLPPYSPDYNPIEEAFSKIKGLLQKAAARTREALIEALGAAISAVNSTDALGFIEHCGYRHRAQPLCIEP